MTHYLIYLRVSTEKQDTRTQLDYCLKFIQQKSIDFTYTVYEDSITSRKAFVDRPGAQRLIAEMKKGDILVAMRLDRIARKLNETTDIIKILDEKGVDIFLVEQPGINNKIMLGVYAGMAEEEVKMLRSRVREKLQAKKNRNERYSGRLPFGYGMHETKLVPIQTDEGIVMKRGILIPLHEEQQVLKIMRELYQEGRSFSEIAKIINELGHRNREGNLFHKMTIYRILKRMPLQGESVPIHT